MGTTGNRGVATGMTADAGDRPDGPPSERSDAELIALIRGRAADPASTEAFGVLYARHREAARVLARQLARSPADADDLVAGAFARLLEVLRSGRGPTEAFRAYLLTAMRHLAYDRTRAERRLDLTDDLAELIGVDPDRTVVPFTDPALAGLERTLAARAFGTLPERWQAVLWHLEVEGDTPADIAPLFGLTANAVSALGYRAREGLRQAYLQEHLTSGSGHRDRRHRETGEKLGAYTRGGLSRRDAARVEAHLAECEECRSLAGELREVNAGLVRAVVGPLVLGAAVMGYLASRGHLVTGATTAEAAVAGGGPLGLITSVGDALRPVGGLGVLAALPGGAVAVTAGAVGAVGLAAVSFALGPSDDGGATAPTTSTPVAGRPAPPGPRDSSRPSPPDGRRVADDGRRPPADVTLPGRAEGPPVARAAPTAPSPGPRPTPSTPPRLAPSPPPRLAPSPPPRLAPSPPPRPTARPAPPHARHRTVETDGPPRHRRAGEPPPPAGQPSRSGGRHHRTTPRPDPSCTPATPPTAPPTAPLRRSAPLSPVCLPAPPSERPVTRSHPLGRAEPRTATS